MANQTSSDDQERVIDSYFSTLATLQRGDRGSVERMMELWSDDAHCEINAAGAPPDEYRGKNAVRALYKSIASSPVQDVQTEKGRTRSTATDVTVEWSSQVGTGANTLQVGGSNQFQFKNGKISGLKIALSPSHAGRELRIQELAVSDIGRLALAAWAVV